MCTKLLTNVGGSCDADLNRFLNLFDVTVVFYLNCLVWTCDIDTEMN